jgi:S-methyl-1-thioxylulose 5-phosphate methylthiotransferase
MGSIHRRGSGPAHRWDGVAVETYAAGGTRQVLIGPGEGPASFALRYFEIRPGTTSTLDTHAHDHGVFVLHGAGRVRLGDAEHTIEPHDVVYVAPHEVHRFEAVGPEPLGFLCVVPAKR